MVGCSSPAVLSNGENGTNSNNGVSAVNTAESDIDKSAQKTTQKAAAENLYIETQIIKELHAAGCLIENFEMNRRKQNLRISCVKEKPSGDFDI